MTGNIQVAGKIHKNKLNIFKQKIDQKVENQKNSNGSSVRERPWKFLANQAILFLAVKTVILEIYLRIRTFFLEKVHKKCLRYFKK